MNSQELGLEMPNYTQFPNAILDNLSKYSAAELKVVAVMFRGSTANPGWSNATIEKATGLSKKTVIDTVRVLRDKGWILKKELSPHEIFEIVSTSNVGNDGKGDETCAWCCAKTYSTQAHHYPISNSNGGTETVDICAKCHAEYHFIETLSLQISVRGAIA